MKPVLVIYTGGTIGMVQRKGSRELIPFDFEQIRKFVPELESFNFSIEHYVFENPIDSSNVTPEIWVELANLVCNLYDKYTGFVVLHGTDTMAFSASALSFMFENLSKPIIFTGSQLPIGHLRTDAKENLITAIEIAGTTKNDKAVVPEVCIYFDYQLLRGNRSIKYNAAKFEAFKSPNYPLLAESGIQIKFYENYIQIPSKLPIEVQTNICKEVAVLKIFPGITPIAVQAITQIRGLRGLVIESFGSGNTTTQVWFTKAIEDLIKRDCLVVNITQCTGGSVDMGKYETSIHLREIGVLSGFDLTFEACITRLMTLLGRFSDIKDAKRYWHISLRGELTD